MRHVTTRFWTMGCLAVALASVAPCTGQPPPDSDKAAPPKRQWVPEQATGAPDTNRAGDLPTAWASLQPDGGIEWLKLDYEKAVSIAEVRVRETFNPGAVSKVVAVSDEGQETTLWEGQDPTSEAPSDFVVKAEKEVVARSVKVYLDTTRKPGWNEIDAVELVGRDDTRQWATGATASSTYASRGGGEPRAQPLTRIPPRVSAVEPPEHATNVSADLKEIKVTFDRPMTTERAWSWILLREHGLYPGVRGGPEPRFDDTGRTCVLPVSLTANAAYAVGINSPQHTGFKDTEGIPALNFGWAFATGGYKTEELPPRVVTTSPKHGETEVDAALTEISVTFDRPMRKDTWSWVLQPQRGEYPGSQEGQPHFDEDGLTCRLPVRLRPGTIYGLSINSYRHTGFKSRAGAPCLPFAWGFKTRGQAVGAAAADGQAVAAAPANEQGAQHPTRGRPLERWEAEALTRLKAFTPTGSTRVLDLERRGKYVSVTRPEGILWLGKKEWVYLTCFSSHGEGDMNLIVDHHGSIYRNSGHCCPTLPLSYDREEDIESLEEFLRTKTGDGDRGHPWELVETATEPRPAPRTALEHQREVALAPEAHTYSRRVALRALAREGSEASWRTVEEALRTTKDWQAFVEVLQLVEKSSPQRAAAVRKALADCLGTEPGTRAGRLAEAITAAETRETVEFFVSLAETECKEQLCAAFENLARAQTEQVFCQLRSFRGIRNSITAYAALAPKRAEEFYRSLLRSASECQRQVGTYGVSELRVADVVDELLALVRRDKENSFFASAVCVALGKIGTPAAHDALVRLLLQEPIVVDQSWSVLVVMTEVCGEAGGSPRGAWGNGCWATVAEDRKAVAERFAQAMNQLADKTKDERLAREARGRASCILSQTKASGR